MAAPSPQASAAIAKAIADRLNTALDQANSLVTNPAEVVADDGLVIAPLLPIQATVRAACRSYARTGAGVSAATDATLGNLCRPYLEDIGEAPLPGSLTPPAFSGGQCSGVQYQISYSATVFATSSTCTPIPINGPITATGPIRGPFFDNQTPPAGDLCPGTSNTTIFVRVGPGQTRQNLAGGSRGARLNSISVTPLSGSDNCGSQPPDYAPPQPRTDLPPYQPTVPVPGTDDETDVDFEFNPDGTININFPDLDVEVEVGGEPGGGLPPGDVGSPGSPVTSADGGTVSGEAPPGKVLTGLQMVLVGGQADASVYYGDVYRGGAWIYMGTPVGQAIHEDGGFIRNGQFVFPKADNLTRWRVTARVGFRWRVTPYFKDA